jgi:cobalt/nickel transport protein
MENRKTQGLTENQQTEVLMVNPKGDSPRENPEGVSPRESQQEGSLKATQRGKDPMGTGRFILIGVAIALLIGAAAVFLASPDPDGLESTTLVVQGQKDLIGAAPDGAEVEEDHTPGGFSYSSPMPDYSLGERMGSPGSILAILAGTLLTVTGALGAVWAMRSLSRPKEEQIKQ